MLKVFRNGFYDFEILFYAFATSLKAFDCKALQKKKMIPVNKISHEKIICEAVTQNLVPNQFSTHKSAVSTDFL